MAYVTRNISASPGSAVVFDDDEKLTLGTLDPFSWAWDTTDADAHHLKGDFVAVGAVDVAILSIGIGINGVDLAFFDGLTEPGFAVVDADRDSYFLFDFRTDDIGRIGVGGTAVSFGLQAAATGEVVFNDSGADVDFRVEGDTDESALFVEGSTDSVIVGGGATPALIDGAADLEVQGDFGILGMIRDTADSNSATLALMKGRSGGVITTGDVLGTIKFFGHDGTDYFTEGGRIEVVSTGTIANNEIGGIMSFHTSPDGATLLQKRWSILSTGVLEANGAQSITTGGNNLGTLNGGTAGWRIDDVLGIDSAPNVNHGISLSRTASGTDHMRSILVTENLTLATAKAGIAIQINPTFILHDDGTHSDIAGLLISDFIVTESTSSTITNLSALYIAGAPIYDGAAGDIANGPYSIFVDAGDVRFDDDVLMSATSAEYFGDTTTDGTWKEVRDGTKLSFLRRESGSYVEKGFFDTSFQTSKLVLNDAVDGIFTGLQITNSQAAVTDSLNETAEIKFGFGSNLDVARISADKLSDYTTGANEDSRLSFHIDKDGTLTESMRIETSTVVVLDGFGAVIGHTKKLSVGGTAQFQVLGTTSSDSAQIIGRWSNNATAPKISFAKSRGTTIGSSVILNDNDTVGLIRFCPDDGADFTTLAAQFGAEVDDASPAVGDIGMAFTWEQMDGEGGALKETMRLAAKGNLGIGVVPNVNRQLDIGGAFNGNTRVSIADTLSASAEAQQIFVGGTIEAFASSSAHGIRIAPTIVKAGSGTHSDFVSLTVVPPTITANSSTLTNVTTVKITGDPTGGINNFALWTIGTSKFAGDMIPEADGTRDLGIQTTAQWANVWADLVNGADIMIANKWRMLESELYAGYPEGWALGHDGSWGDGKSLWKNPSMITPEQRPVFVVTDEFIEYKERRLTPAILDKLLELVEA